MLVKDFMTPSVYTVREDQSILEAREILASKGLISLPVVDDLKRVRGMITIDDIGKASPSAGSTLSRYEANYLLGRLKVKELMTRNVIAVSEDDSIEYVCYQIYKNKMNAFPVVDANNKLCGIIAQNDIFGAFVEAFRLHLPCTRITIEVKDEVGIMASLSKIFQENEINILSMLVHGADDQGIAEIVIRAELDNRLDVIEQIREAGFDVTDIMTIRGME